MKVLVVGSGGREHALVKSFLSSPSVTQVHVVPGNDGMALEAHCHKISMSNFEAITQLCLKNHIDFVFIGPEDPLVAGLSDHLRQNKIAVVGPEKKAAQLEGSKIFAKKFMIEARVPTAKYFVVTSVPEVLEHAKNFHPPYVLKADGLAAGKGVSICQDIQELQTAAEDLFVKKILGPAGEKALLEEFKEGWELSYLVLTNGSQHQTLPLAQDHKRLYNGQQGPNTGGMGTIAPLQIDKQLRNEIEKKIVEPSIQQLHRMGCIYNGVLFIGVMVTKNGPQVLEYNVRFGDPETQVILPLLDVDTGILFQNLAEGKLLATPLKPLSACCVILAAPGYPSAPIKGNVITGLDIKQSKTQYLIHSGTKFHSGNWVTQGGRVLGAVGLGQDTPTAIEKAYLLAKKIQFDGMQLRSDIGKSQL